MFTEPIVIAASCTSQTKPASCGCYAALRIMRTRVFPSVHLEDVILSCLLTRCSRHSLHSCALMRSHILICPSYAVLSTPLAAACLHRKSACRPRNVHCLAPVNWLRGSTGAWTPQTLQQGSNSSSDAGTNNNGCCDDPKCRRCAQKLLPSP